MRVNNLFVLPHYNISKAVVVASETRIRTNGVLGYILKMSRMSTISVISLIHFLQATTEVHSSIQHIIVIIFLP